jgi:hypothetical protein
MSVITDTKATLKRIRDYGNEMKGLLSRHNVHNIDDLGRIAKDPLFLSEVAALWDELLKAEGGKMTLTVVLGTIAIAMGGVGIAAGGSAIGLPLILILAPLGYFGGQELDSEGYTKAVVDRFEELLRMIRKLDSQQYSEMVADKFNKLLESVHWLDAERHKYTDGMIGRLKKLGGTTGGTSS